jgi:hypothetical protein
VRTLIIAGIVAAAASAVGCATTGAKAQPEPIALDVPAPPPRVIVPPEPEQAAPETPAKDPEPSQQKPPRRTPQPRPETRKDPAAAQKVDPPAPAAPPAVEPARPATSPTATLQQALPAQTNEMERQVREQLGKAKADLDRVNYKALNKDGQSQYDAAKRFITQAEQALDEKNVVFASKTAEKAAGLAAGLLGR